MANIVLPEGWIELEVSHLFDANNALKFCVIDIGKENVSGSGLIINVDLRLAFIRKFASVKKCELIYPDKYKMKLRMISEDEFNQLFDD